MSGAPLLGLVLAGGRSRRLGTDKAAVHAGGESLLDRAVARLAAVLPEVYVSVRPDQAGDAVRTRHPLLLDPSAGLGPAAGLLAAHGARPDAAWLVLACDMPWVDHAHVAELVARRDPARAGTAWLNPETAGIEPLCAIYEPATLARLAGEAAAGKPAGPRALLADSDVLLLRSDRPEVFSSINTPADLDRLGKR